MEYSDSPEDTLYPRDSFVVPETSDPTSERLYLFLACRSPMALPLGLSVIFCSAIHS